MRLKVQFVNDPTVYTITLPLYWQERIVQLVHAPHEMIRFTDVNALPVLINRNHVLWMRVETDTE